MDLKDKFKSSMAILYPEGVPTLNQVRDLALAFSMAWAECFVSIVDHGNEVVGKPLRAKACQRAIESWREDTAGQQSKEWMPDQSWLWWPAKIASADEMAAVAAQAAAQPVPKPEEHHITMIDGVALKSPIVQSKAPARGDLIPHLGKITAATCYQRSHGETLNLSRWTVQTEQHSCQP